MFKAFRKTFLSRQAVLALLLIAQISFSSFTISARTSNSSANAISPTLLPDSLNVTVHFIDVGMGDSIFIETYGKNVLIDGGLPDAGKKVLSYLESLNVTEIDLMIATHPHEDHVGGLTTVLNSSICVDQVLFNNDNNTANSPDTYSKFLALATSHNLTVAYRGQTYALTDTASLTVLNPVQPLQFTQNPGSINENTVNNNGIVVKLQFGNTSFMFTGDAEAAAEQSMLTAGLNLRSDVLKVGWHGMGGATTRYFLDSVMPSYAVITAGIPNKYGAIAPAIETIDRLLTKNVTILGSQVHGTVRATTDGTSTAFSTPAHSLPQDALHAELAAHEWAVYSVAWSPRGSFVASGSQDGTVRLWDSRTWENVGTINAFSRGVQSVAWSPNGNKLAVAGFGGAGIWDFLTQTKLVALNLTSAGSCIVYSASWSPDGMLVATTDSFGRIVIFDSDTGDVSSRLGTFSPPAIATAWSPDGSRLATGSLDGSTTIWNVTNWTRGFVVRANTWSPRCEANGLAWSPDGTLLAVASQEGIVRIWDALKGTEKSVLGGHLGGAKGVAWSHHENILATSGQDTIIRLWNPETGELLAELKEHHSPVWGVTWSPDGSRIASGSGIFLEQGDTRVLIWIIHERLRADLNWDGQVNIMDIAIVAIAFGSELGHTRWNTLADVDRNELVDIRDIAVVARDFGRHV